jgi:hypothetical protein
VSRAYYGVFGEIREFYRRNGIRFPDREVHRWLPASIQSCKEKYFVDMAQDLRDLCDCRKRADYDLTENEIEDLELCKHLVHTADDLLVEFRRRQAESLKHVQEYVNIRSRGQRG